MNEEGLKNVYHIMKIFINWMYANKYSAAKLAFNTNESQI